MDTQATGPTCLLSLPAELLLDIANRLDLKTYLKLRSTCRYFSSLELEKFHKNHFNSVQTTVSPQHIDRAIRVLESRSPVGRQIRTLILSFPYSEVFPRTSWKLDVSIQYTHNIPVAAIISKLPNLQRLEVRTLDFTATKPQMAMSDLLHALKSSTAPLKSLYLNACRLTGENISAILSSIPSLRTLHITQNTGVYDLCEGGWLAVLTPIAGFQDLQLEKLELQDGESMLENVDKALYRGGSAISKTFRTVTGLQQYCLGDRRSVMVGGEAIKAGLEIILGQWR